LALVKERQTVCPLSVSVRDQRQRWGSCSEKGTISLNWRLLLLPPELSDHIILHELAHLVEMSHSARFYMVLQKIDPNSDRNRKHLKRIEKEVIVLAS
jgi:predicted metal-dependent hydrolase